MHYISDKWKVSKITNFCFIFIKKKWLWFFFKNNIFVQTKKKEEKKDSLCPLDFGKKKS